MTTVQVASGTLSETDVRDAADMLDRVADRVE